MPFVSVTRLRIRSVRFLPVFFVNVWRTARQVRRTPGFVGGQLAIGPHQTYWTVTVWESQSAMREYRDSGAHLHTMPHLLQWSDEAARVHWEQPDATVPLLHEVAERLSREGQLSKLTYPSWAHANGQVWPDGQVPVGTLRLRPSILPR